mgnify:CR=1 FL=1
MLEDDIMSAEKLDGGDVAAAVRKNIIEHKISLKAAVEKLNYEVGA